MRFSYVFNNTEHVVWVLNEIVSLYVHQNVKYKSVESPKTLEFLGKKLPILKDQLEAGSSILNDFRNKKARLI